MKTKLIIVLLIGMVLGSLLGGIIVPLARAQTYLYQLDDVIKYLKSIDSRLSHIEFDTRLIYKKLQ
jgi:hypothetical protein